MNRSRCSEYRCQRGDPSGMLDKLRRLICPSTSHIRFCPVISLKTRIHAYTRINSLVKRSRSARSRSRRKAESRTRNCLGQVLVFPHKCLRASGWIGACKPAKEMTRTGRRDGLMYAVCINRTALCSFRLPLHQPRESYFASGRCGYR